MGGGFADVALAREDLEQEIRDQVHQAFEGMMHALYRQEGAMLQVEIIQEPEVTDFISTHAGVLNQAMQRAPLSDAMRHRLERSNFIFSGFKTYHELNEAFFSLIDENGERKPFERFLNDVLAIDSTYNRNYLRAEYNFCQASADMAAKWEQIVADGDRYNLQYRTQHDDKVRPEHAALDGVTLPPSDPFWESYYPPNGWNCRCTVAQVRKSKYPVTDPEEARARGEEALQKDTRGIFRFNSGKQGKTFPDYNPYTISRCRDCDIAQGKVNLAYIPDNEFCNVCPLIRKCEAQRFDVVKQFDNGGSIAVHQLVNPEDSDYNKLMDIATFFAEQGKEVRLTPKMTRSPQFMYRNIYESLMGTPYEGKCPDLWVDGVWYEHEGFVTNNAKRAFRNMMNDGLRQSDRLIIDKPELKDAYMKRVIHQRVKDGQVISEVWLKEGKNIRILYKKFEE